MSRTVKYIIDIDKKNVCSDDDGSQLAITVKINDASAIFCTEIPLTPYTEDSAYAHGYTEAESKYREIRDELEKQAYQRGYETAKHECEANIQSNRDEAYNKGHNDGFKFGYEKLKDLEHERVEKAYQRGYKEAYDTAYADAEEIYESGKRAMYQKGLKDAWEAARKIQDTGGNLRWWIHNTTASEAIEKLKEYEQKQEEIKVGDEVTFLPNNAKGIVTECHVPDVYSDNDKYAVWCGGTMEYVLKQHLTKTGRTFPEIAEVLQKMKESDNG